MKNERFLCNQIFWQYAFKIMSLGLLVMIISKARNISKFPFNVTKSELFMSSMGVLLKSVRGCGTNVLNLQLAQPLILVRNLLTQRFQFAFEAMCLLFSIGTLLLLSRLKIKETIKLSADIFFFAHFRTVHAQDQASPIALTS